MLDTFVPILYWGEELIAVDKPAGLDVGGSPKAQGVGVVGLVSALAGLKETLYPANRLSRFESGVILLARNPGTASRIRALVNSFQVEQEFIAVVNGRMEKSTLLLTAQGRRRDEKNMKKGRPLRSTPMGRGPAVSKERTGRTVLKRIKRGQYRTRVHCETTAPTTHALRAQLRSVGLRLVGDRVREPSPRPMVYEDTCLHLSRVRLRFAGRKGALTVRSPAPTAFAAALRGERDVHRPLHAALARRLPCFLDTDTDSIRLLTGPVEGVPGLIAEKYGPVIVLQVLDAAPRRPGALADIARWYRDLLCVRAVYAKRFVKDRMRLTDDDREALHSPRPLLGDPAPPELEIHERGLCFAIRPYDGFSVGLFLDQRENRSRIREMSRGKEALNLFAYTCGFSVAAAVGGAKSTTSVDVSPKHLAWGRTNFALNGLDLTDHSFIRSDALEYLIRAKRQGKAFDIIVLDPPTFAHGRRSRHDFSVLDDLAGLVACASEVLRPEGVMMVSTNHRKLSHRGLWDRIRQGLGSRRLEVLTTPPLPLDFGVDPDHAKTVFVRCAGCQA